MEVYHLDWFFLKIRYYIALSVIEIDLKGCREYVLQIWQCSGWEQVSHDVSGNTEKKLASVPSVPGSYYVFIIGLIYFGPEESIDFAECFCILTTKLFKSKLTKSPMAWFSGSSPDLPNDPTVFL